MRALLTTRFAQCDGFFLLLGSPRTLPPPCLGDDLGFVAVDFAEGRFDGLSDGRHQYSATIFAAVVLVAFTRLTDIGRIVPS